MPSVGQGGTLRLRVQFLDGSGALVTPANPLVDILNPLGTAVVTDAVPISEGVGQYYYDYAVPSNAPLGTWTAHWTGSINGSPVAADENFDVVVAGTIIPTEGQGLLSLAELKTALGITGTQQDAKLAFYIEAATEAILRYTGRDFVPNALPGIRSFLHDGNGFMEISDATSITSVSVNGTTLAPEAFIAQPFRGPVYTWLELPPFRAQSFEMGFTQNLDQSWGRRRLFQPQTVEVTADWGWPYVPKDVKMAAVWTVADMKDNPAGHQSQSIAGYSVSSGGAFVPGGDTAIPDRALKILDLYVRVNL